MSRFPPLNSVRAFEVVARTRNLTAAAQELHVTQSAVSRQIALLESYLEKKLFSRNHRGMTLTQLGAIYAEQIIPAFEDIARASESLDKSDSSIRVRAPTSFSAKWLIPNMPDFENQYPTIKVHLINALPGVDSDYDNDPVDVTVVRGPEHWQKANAKVLFEDAMEPVCSPGYLAKHGADPDRTSGLLGHRLLISRHRRRDWDDWLAATELGHMAANTERMTFGVSFLTWQAAIDGLGIAIGQLPYLHRDLANGALLRPFGRPVHQRSAHYLVTTTPTRQTRAARIFLEWLQDRVSEDLTVSPSRTKTPPLTAALAQPTV